MVFVCGMYVDVAPWRIHLQDVQASSVGWSFSQHIYGSMQVLSSVFCVVAAYLLRIRMMTPAAPGVVLLDPLLRMILLWCIWYSPASCCTCVSMPFTLEASFVSVRMVIYDLVVLIIACMAGHDALIPLQFSVAATIVWLIFMMW